ncbi:hypothetical protein BROC_00768 [Candidatus Brocadiaceae bacterium]|nr:hypothetical protein BROC_00768 [Candidatus Brocadiaceae bacterium]
MKEKKQPSFKDKMQRLVTISEQLGDSQTELEEALALSEEGLKLYAELSKMLKDTSLQVKTLEKELLKESELPSESENENA